jgi:hypothetical protein
MFTDCMESIGVNFMSSYIIHQTRNHLGFLCVPIYNFENRVCGVMAGVGIAGEVPALTEKNMISETALLISKRLGLIYER